MILKKAEVVLTKEEVESPEPIRIVLTVTDGEDGVDYTIDYPKEVK